MKTVNLSLVSETEGSIRSNFPKLVFGHLIYFNALEWIKAIRAIFFILKGI